MQSTEYLKAHKIKDLPGLPVVMAHLFPHRTDNEAYLLETFDITEILAFLEEENSKHPEYKTTLFHCIIYALAKMVNERPKMNRYIQGQQFWQREHISIGFVARRRFQDVSEEALMVFAPTLQETLDDITKWIVGDVRTMRKKESADSGLDGTMNAFTKIPPFIRMILMGLLRFASFCNIVPKSLKLGDTNFTSIFLTNLGSVKCPAVYHHLNNYGTNSIMIAVGVMRKEEIIMPDGTKAIRDVVDIGTTIDERIGDGFYFARSLKLVKYLFSHPEMLRQPLSQCSNFDYN